MIVWEQFVDTTCYQVRSAGQSLRLYTNGVFHSQYNPLRPLTGNVWDLLMLPAYFYPRGQIQRVLVLGVGGGAVIQQLRHFVQPGAITGVELNAVHISVAKRFFGVRGRDVKLVQADAVRWVSDYRGAPFDMIIDDLFGDRGGEAERAVTADRDWASRLSPLLAEDGLLVSNFASLKELKQSAWYAEPRTSKLFCSAFSLSTPQNYNAVGAFLKRPATARQLRERLCMNRELNPRRKSSALDYRIRSLFSQDPASLRFASR